MPIMPNATIDFTLKQQKAVKGGTEKYLYLIDLPKINPI